MSPAVAEPIEAPPHDDISDPQTPPGALAPLPEPTLAQVRDDLRAVSRALDASFDKLMPVLDTQYRAFATLVKTQMSTLNPVEAGALEHLCEALQAVQEKGLQIQGSPYTATISATTPGGYTVLLSIQRQDGAVFLAALAGLEAWLKTEGYTPAT